jgi:ABC-type phosphate transport system substrate-binding protein
MEARAAVIAVCLEVLTLRRVLSSVVVIAALAFGAAPSPGSNAGFRVIVHHEVKGARIARNILSSIFLKQVPKWGDGSPIFPIDQSVRSDVRRSFSGEVLNQGVAEVQLYWQRKMSAGFVPPPVKTSDEDVVAFVASTPGAIGYVSATAAIPESVKAVELAD